MGKSQTPARSSLTHSGSTSSDFKHHLGKGLEPLWQRQGRNGQLISLSLNPNPHSTVIKRFVVMNPTNPDRVCDVWAAQRLKLVTTEGGSWMVADPAVLLILRGTVIP